MAPDSAPWIHYDLTPFNDVPAILSKAKAKGNLGGPIPIKYIPQKGLLSPFVSNLTANQVKQWKNNLTGPKGRNFLRSRNGREIWLSWKRAWDVYNNNYIPGRENPAWIRGEYERLNEAISKARRDQAYCDSREPLDVPTITGNGVVFKVASDRNRSTADEDLASRTLSPEETAYTDEEGFLASGGFVALKHRPLYTHGTGDNDASEDKIMNTLWRPRRSGEESETLEIGVDRERFDNFWSSDFNVDGGVDCARVPFPVLRPIVKHIMKGKAPNYIKKKTWDGVTGTIFNMPTSIPGQDEGAEDRIERMKRLYGDDRLTHFESKRHDFFPLDIRRVDVKKVRDDKPRLEGVKRRPICAPDEEDLSAVEYPVGFDIETTRRLSPVDAWWVTNTQRRKRDVPRRRYPQPPTPKSQRIFHYDTKLWDEERLNDKRGDSLYFVANLHGGALLVNGVAVNKGDVAGPLPDFAIIECPGGQIAFWWGRNGKDVGAGPYIPIEEVRRSWSELRRADSENWGDVGLTAGQFYHSLIMDRINREASGNNLHDDARWERWKAAEKPDVESRELWTSLSEGPPYRTDGTVSYPGYFPDEGAELEWLFTEVENGQRIMSEALKVHDPEMAWPGSRVGPSEEALAMRGKIDIEWQKVRGRWIATNRALKRRLERDRDAEVSEKLATAREEWERAEEADEALDVQRVEAATRRTKKEARGPAEAAATLTPAELPEKALKEAAALGQVAKKLGKDVASVEVREQRKKDILAMEEREKGIWFKYNEIRKKRGDEPLTRNIPWSEPKDLDVLIDAGLAAAKRFHDVSAPSGSKKRATSGDDGDNGIKRAKRAREDSQGTSRKLQRMSRTPPTPSVARPRSTDGLPGLRQQSYTDMTPDKRPWPAPSAADDDESRGERQGDISSHESGAGFPGAPSQPAPDDGRPSPPAAAASSRPQRSSSQERAVLALERAKEESLRREAISEGRSKEEYCKNELGADYDMYMRDYLAPFRPLPNVQRRPNSLSSQAWPPETWALWDASRHTVYRGALRYVASLARIRGQTPGQVASSLGFETAEAFAGSERERLITPDLIPLPVHGLPASGDAILREALLERARDVRRLREAALNQVLHDAEHWDVRLAARWEPVVQEGYMHDVEADTTTTKIFAHV